MIEEIKLRAKNFWKVAGTFPADKEAVYPEHAEAQEFNIYQGRHVLEYGCGGGSDAMSYLRRGNYVTLCDIVPENVMAAMRRIHSARLIDGASFRSLEESSPLPFPTGFFDIVNAHGVIHHIEDPEPVLREFYRVLKPGGLVYVMLYTEILYASFNVQAVMERRRVSEGEAFGYCTDCEGEEGCPYARPYSRADGALLLDRAGFAVTRIFEYNNRFFRTFRGRKQ